VGQITFLTAMYADTNLRILRTRLAEFGFSDVEIEALSVANGLGSLRTSEGTSVEWELTWSSSRRAYFEVEFNYTETVSGFRVQSFNVISLPFQRWPGRSGLPNGGLVVGTRQHTAFVGRLVSIAAAARLKIAETARTREERVAIFNEQRLNAVRTLLAQPVVWSEYTQVLNKNSARHRVGSMTCSKAGPRPQRDYHYIGFLCDATFDVDTYCLNVSTRTNEVRQVYLEARLPEEPDENISLTWLLKGARSSSVFESEGEWEECRGSYDFFGDRFQGFGIGSARDGRDTVPQAIISSIEPEIGARLADASIPHDSPARGFAKSSEATTGWVPAALTGAYFVHTKKIANEMFGLGVMTLSERESDRDSLYARISYEYVDGASTYRVDGSGRATLSGETITILWQSPGDVDSCPINTTGKIECTGREVEWIASRR